MITDPQRAPRDRATRPRHTGLDWLAGEEAGNLDGRRPFFIWKGVKQLAKPID